MGTFNTYGNKSKKYGGAYPVWLTVSQKERAGGILEKTEAGMLLRAGSLVAIDNKKGEAKVIETYEIAEIMEGIGGTEITVTLYAYDSHPKLKEGTLLMKAPSKVADWGRGLKVTGLTRDQANKTCSFSIPSAGFGTLAKGDILVQATKEGEEASIYAIPTGLSENDVYVEDGDYAATVASVYHGEIMEERIQPIPQCVRELLPMIKFVKGV